MAETTITTTETPHNPQRSSSSTAAPVTRGERADRGDRGRLVQTVQHGSVIATPERGEGATVQTIKSSPSDTPRVLSEKTRTMLANLDKHGDVRGPDTIEEAKPDEPKVEAKDEKKPPPAADTAAPKTEAKPDPAPDKPAVEPAKPDTELTARVERLTEHNKRLVTEMEQLRAKHADPEPDERMKSLDAIERGMTADFLGAIRKLVALNADIKDPASADVDKLMAGAYYEWTSHELKIPLDDAKRAAIGSDRNRLLIERDKRDRDAKEKSATTKAEADHEAAKHAGIGRDLGKHLDDSKHAEKYPLMMKLAQRIDGQSPGALLWSAIRRGISAGEFPQDTDDNTLITHYSKEIEKHYTPIGEAFAAGNSPSTAPNQTPATVPPKDQAADAPQAGARTITNASASVAPPAPPVAATPPAETAKPRKVSEETRRRQIAAKYFPD